MTRRHHDALYIFQTSDYNLLALGAGAVHSLKFFC